MVSRGPSPSFSWVSCIFIEFVVFFTSYRISLGVVGGHDLINLRDSIRFVLCCSLSESEYEYSNFTLFKQSVVGRSICQNRKEFYSAQKSWTRKYLLKKEESKHQVHTERERDELDWASSTRPVGVKTNEHQVSVFVQGPLNPVSE